MREVSSIAFNQLFAADGLPRPAVSFDLSIASVVMAKSSRGPGSYKADCLPQVLTGRVKDAGSHRVCALSSR